MAEPRYDKVTEFCLSLYHRYFSSAEPSVISPALGPYRTKAEVSQIEPNSIPRSLEERSSLETITPNDDDLNIPDTGGPVSILR